MSKARGLYICHRNIGDNICQMFGKRMVHGENTAGEATTCMNYKYMSVGVGICHISTGVDGPPSLSWRRPCASREVLAEQMAPPCSNRPSRLRNA